MKKFSDYASKNKRTGEGKKDFGANGAIPPSAFEALKSLAGNFEGASEEDILKRIYGEAAKSKKRGTLTDGEIDNFVATISPALNSEQRVKLKKLADKLKKM